MASQKVQVGSRTVSVSDKSLKAMSRAVRNGERITINLKSYTLYFEPMKDDHLWYTSKDEQASMVISHILDGTDYITLD